MNIPFAPAVRVFWAAVAGLYHELTEMRLSGDRGRRCTVAALSVALATAVALAVRVDEVWWAATSGFVCSQATAPASVQRGILRIFGTITGASLTMAMIPLLVDDQVALSLALFLVSTAGVLGLLVSPHGYAWFLGAITADMVLLALLSAPMTALTVGVDRTGEVMIGTLAAMLVAILIGSSADATPVAPPPGWSDLLGARWPTVRHALRAGLGVMLVPLVWEWLDLPSLSQTGITIAAVMAVPALTSNEATDRAKIIERSMHRILGCLFGGVAGLGCLALSVETFLPWMMLLIAGIWIAAHVQASERGIGYVGTQGAMVFISTLVQGLGPPNSILPGIERFAGIMGGLLILLAVTVLTTQPQTAERGPAMGGSV